MTTVDVQALLGATGGAIPLRAELVPRGFAPPGKRLGLPDEAYDAGERGFVQERWIASTTLADSPDGPDGEGLSRIAAPGFEHATLASVIDARPDLLLGARYAAAHPQGLGVLSKLLDYGARINYHVHPREQHSRLVGRNPKDEAYYFPTGVELGPQPESFFGFLPGFAQADVYARLLDKLVAWRDDSVLELAQAVRIEPGTGFFVPSGFMHAPGTALTLEIQEPSDTLAMFQAVNGGRPTSKELLFKDVRPEDRATHGEAFLLEWIDWAANADPYLYRNHVTRPQRIVETDDAIEDWIVYGTTKFSGKKVVVKPGRTYRTIEPGAHALLAWSGRGAVDGTPLVGRSPGSDEVFLAHGAATAEHELRNDSADGEFVVFRFFGPDLHRTPDLAHTP